MSNDLIQQITALLPGFNCGSCKNARCDLFAKKLVLNEASCDGCMFLMQEKYAKNKEEIMEILTGSFSDVKEKDKNTVIGLLDKYEADFILKPLPDENSCREVLYPFTKKELKEGMNIRYRPLGCPITHFAHIIKEYYGLITVHMTGPCHRLGEEDFEYEEVGVCMVGGFEGIIEGELPFVGQTVRFLPQHCMMQKVHSGVVVQIEGKKAVIEGIDLKVWAPPITGKAGQQDD